MFQKKQETLVDHYEGLSRLLSDMFRTCVYAPQGNIYGSAVLIFSLKMEFCPKHVA